MLELAVTTKMSPERVWMHPRPRHQDAPDGAPGSGRMHEGTQRGSAEPAAALCPRQGRTPCQLCPLCAYLGDTNRLAWV